jgi:hypothetical protein
MLRRALPIILAASLLVAAPASAEVIQHGGVRVSFQGRLVPRRLPREGSAPAAADLAAKISGVEGAPPPALRTIEIEVNRHGRFDRSGLPVCTMDEVQPTTDADAMRACGRSLVGEGEFSAQVGLGAQAPFPAGGKLLAFNGTYHGAPAILAHVYGTEPAPTSYTLPFLIGQGHGTYGTVLRASVNGAAGTSGYISGLSLDLGRTWGYRGHRHSYLSAGCPAPQGFPGADFPFARASFGFAGGAKLRSTITRSCRASGR